MKFFFPENSYYRQVLKTALPAIAGLSTQMVVSLVDAAMVGRLENAEYSLAAMGIGVLATWALISFFSSIATGTHVIVARHYGSGSFEECGSVLNNSIILSVGIGIIVAFLGVFYSHEIGHFFAADPKVGNLAGDFLHYRFMSIPFFLISVSYRGFFFGINKIKIFMYSGIITNMLNIFFNSILIYGNLGFPRMGVAGAGLGSSLATSFDFIFYGIIILLPSYRHKYQNFRKFKINFKVIRQIYKISIPVSFHNVFVLIGFLSFVSITGIIGTVEQAATQAVISALMMSLLPCFGFGIAVQTLVGNNLGSAKFRIAKIYGYETAKVATYYTIALGIIFMIIPRIVLLLITTDEKIIETAVIPLQIAGAAQVLYASGVVFANALQAAGKTFYVMMAEVITNLVIFVPLVYLLGIVLNLGINWTWGGLVFYSLIYSAILFRKFNKGDWQKSALE